MANSADAVRIIGTSVPPQPIERLVDVWDVHVRGEGRVMMSFVAKLGFYVLVHELTEEVWRENYGSGWWGVAWQSL